MVRIMTVNKFVNSRNKLLFRWPIHRQIANNQNRYTSLPKIGGNSLIEFVENSSNMVNNIGTRLKSTSTDGNISMLQLKQSPTPQTKSKKSKMIKTTITEITESSVTSKQGSVGLFRKKSLTNFVTNSTRDVAKATNMPIIYEKPILFTPNDFKIDTEKNKELLENLAKSFEEFILKYAKSVPMLERAPEEEPEIVPTETKQQSESDAVLQKDFTKSNQRDGRHYQVSMTANLKAYLNACVTLDMTERAFYCLNTFRKKLMNGTKLVRTNDPELYMDLMAKYASNKNWNRVKEMYSMLLEENVPITPQIYMTMLDCLGRSPGNNKLIETCLKMANQKKITLNDIMDKSHFVKDQRTYVLEAIRRHKPDFSPVYTPPQLEYNNKLLNSMNKYVHPIEKKPYETIDNSTGCEISNSKFGFSPQQLNEYAKQQFQIETDGRVSVKNITMLDESKYMNNHVLKKREVMDNLLKQWRCDLITALQNKLNILRHKMRTESTRQMTVYSYLNLLTPEEIVEILLDHLKSLMHGSQSYSSTTFEISAAIGRKIMQKHQLNLRNQYGINHKTVQLYKTYHDILCSGKCVENPRQLWQRIIHHSRNDGPCLDYKNINWPLNVRLNVGRTLHKLLVENIKIDENLMQTKKPKDLVPVIYTLFRTRNLKAREEIKIHPLFVSLYREAKIDTINFNANEIPMLCPAVPWISVDSGGYLISGSELIRVPLEFGKQVELIRTAPPSQMYPSFDTLNQLSSVPWRINTRILDLAIKVFNLGGNEKLNVPLTPDKLLTDEQLKYRGMTRNDLFKKKKNADRNYSQSQMDLFSIYSDTIYKLSLANHFRDRPFWLPHNLDFRGRTYPIPPHLTHLSADLTRSMLCFHQKQPLGPFGLDWLKLHCINLTGLKKRNSVEERMLYVNNIIDDIIDSADNPLDGRQWWLNSDDPWQTLAACMEITDAIRSPNPEMYMSSFPIHQDGSCNGLQHYAALGRDVDGAASVNLTPTNNPQDVYSTISNRVEELRKRDAEQGNRIAIELDGYIKRKIVKQTVMTTVYGVTQYGSFLQVQKQLKNIDFNPNTLSEASRYITKAIFASLSDTFSSAREIQNWLTECASVISKQSHVEWISPLGLPIIQPYIRKQSSSINASLTKLSSNDVQINNLKEKNAFSPNFIHSLDSCHMMLTALNCERTGVTFVSVHDCFWTHANTVPVMNRICREQFIRLHSQPILEDLGESFYQRYDIISRQVKKQKKNKKLEENEESTDEEAGAKADKKALFKRIPAKGKFELKNVLESVHFFS